MPARTYKNVIDIQVPTARADIRSTAVQIGSDIRAYTLAVNRALIVNKRESKVLYKIGAEVSYDGGNTWVQGAACDVTDGEFTTQFGNKAAYTTLTAGLDPQVGSTLRLIRPNATILELDEPIRMDLDVLVDKVQKIRSPVAPS